MTETKPMMWSGAVKSSYTKTHIRGRVYQIYMYIYIVRIVTEVAGKL